MQNAESPSSKEVVSLREYVQKTAQQLIDYSLQIQTGDRVLIKLAPACKELGDEVIRILKERGIQSFIQVLSPEIDKVVLEGVSAGNDSMPLKPNQLPDGTVLSEEDRVIDDSTFTDSQRMAAFFHHGSGSDEANLLSACNKVLIIKERTEISGKYEIDPEVEKEKESMDRVLSTVRTKERQWCLISVPTEKSVRPKGMSFEDYSRLYYEACSRPWDEVEKAQDVLVEKFTGKETVQIDVPAPAGFGSEWETHLTMRIRGQRPINSVARRNMPGSEVYMSPNIDKDEAGNRVGTLNGVFAVPYPVYFKERILPNFKVTFKDGKATEWFTTGGEEDMAFLTKVLTSDDGASWCGELGIGTNPIVNIPVPDTLLAEKSFGFHLAFGKAYEDKEYFGKSVYVDNGNRSNIHIDVVRIMTEEYGGGTIVVDGETILANGKFQDPRLNVLNAA